MVSKKQKTAAKSALKPKPRAVVIGPVVVDSGPLLALFNRSDAWHETVVTWLQRNTQVQLITTWPVCTEVCALLARRIGNSAALDFLRWAIRGGIAIDAPDGNMLAEVLSTSERIQDLPVALADASVAEAAARLNVRSVLTIDSDFDLYRDKAGKPLVNVLR